MCWRLRTGRETGYWLDSMVRCRLFIWDGWSRLTDGLGGMWDIARWLLRVYRSLLFAHANTLPSRRRRSPSAGRTVARGAPPACVRGTLSLLTHLYSLVFTLRLSARLIFSDIPVLRSSAHPFVLPCRVVRAFLIEEAKVVKTDT